MCELREFSETIAFLVVAWKAPWFPLPHNIFSVWVCCCQPCLTAFSGSHIPSVPFLAGGLSSLWWSCSCMCFWTPQCLFSVSHHVGPTSGPKFPAVHQPSLHSNAFLHNTPSFLQCTLYVPWENSSLSSLLVDIKENLLSFKKISCKPLKQKCKIFLCSLDHVLGQWLLLSVVWTLHILFPSPWSMISGEMSLQFLLGTASAGKTSSGLQGIVTISHAGRNSPSTLEKFHDSSPDPALVLNLCRFPVTYRQREGPDSDFCASCPSWHGSVLSREKRNSFPGENCRHLHALAQAHLRCAPAQLWGMGT